MISYFSDSTVADGTYVTSYINRVDLVTAIQSDSTDTYFDSTSEIYKVYVYYTHEEGRQVKKIVHDGTNLSGQVLWSSNAKDGTWQKTKIIAFDEEMAQYELNRIKIGSEEDLTHSDGVITLNI